MSYEAVDVALIGWVNRANPRTGDLVTWEIAPEQADVGGLSVATDGIEWLWVADDSTDEYPLNPWAWGPDPGCNGRRGCDK